MIDPHNVTDFNRTREQLEELALFSLLVAGKRATTVAVRLDKLLTDLGRAAVNGSGPADSILGVGSAAALTGLLRSYGFGCYTRAARNAWQLCQKIASGELDLTTCKVGELEALPGWGAKTARFFLLHSRKGVRLAALDTHMLAHLRANGIKAPKTTPPPGEAYRKLEEAWLKLADKAGMSPAEFDLKVWRAGTTSKPIT